MYMKLKDGKSKVLTFSYDDATVEDIRLIEIFDKHGLKGTFNVNSGLYLPEDATREKYTGRMKLSEAKELYIHSGHEVAVHGYMHTFIDRIPLDEVIPEVLEDRKNLEAQYGVVVKGMAYPYGLFNEKIMDLVGKCGISYARTTRNTENFSFPQDWLAFHPTCRHASPKLMELAKKFVEEKGKHISENWLFCVWGHSREFGRDDNWDVMETFAEYVGGKDDIWYATNMEIYDYVKAYERLVTSVDKSIVHNPSAMDVWFSYKNEVYCVKAGQTLYL